LEATSLRFSAINQLNVLLEGDSGMGRAICTPSQVKKTLAKAQIVNTNQEDAQP
jgi:hypothetical protein